MSIAANVGNRGSANGEEIIIARNGEPPARLVALSPKVVRTPGKGAGKWKVSPDFNDALPAELLEGFMGKRK